MELEGKGKRLKIYIGETDQYHGEPLYHAIVKLAKAEGLAGATVMRGLEGFGADSRIHTAKILRFSEDLPIVIEIIDRAERIDAFAAKIAPMVKGGLMTTHEVTIIKYACSQ